MEAEMIKEVRDFCIRVLHGNCNMQETAILPKILGYYLETKKTISGN